MKKKIFIFITICLFSKLSISQEKKQERPKNIFDVNIEASAEINQTVSNYFKTTHNFGMGVGIKSVFLKSNKKGISFGMCANYFDPNFFMLQPRLGYRYFITNNLYTEPQIGYCVNSIKNNVLGLLEVGYKFEGPVKLGVYTQINFLSQYNYASLGVAWKFDN